MYEQCFRFDIDNLVQEKFKTEIVGAILDLLAY